MCSILDCQKDVYAKGWCLTHYTRNRRHGDPLAYLQVSSNTYEAVHQRLYRLRGKASQHQCVSCGAPARDWAWDHLDVPVHGLDHRGRNVRYSLNLDRYVAMCKPCHNRMDARMRRLVA